VRGPVQEGEAGLTQQAARKGEKLKRDRTRCGKGNFPPKGRNSQTKSGGTQDRDERGEKGLNEQNPQKIRKLSGHVPVKGEVQVRGRSGRKIFESGKTQRRVGTGEVSL